MFRWQCNTWRLGTTYVNCESHLEPWSVALRQFVSFSGFDGSSKMWLRSFCILRRPFSALHTPSSDFIALPLHSGSKLGLISLKHCIVYNILFVCFSLPIESTILVLANILFTSSHWGKLCTWLTQHFGANALLDPIPGITYAQIWVKNFLLSM